MNKNVILGGVAGGVIVLAIGMVASTMRSAESAADTARRLTSQPLEPGGEAMARGAPAGREATPGPPDDVGRRLTAGGRAPGRDTAEAPADDPDPQSRTATRSTACWARPPAAARWPRPPCAQRRARLDVTACGLRWHGPISVVGAPSRSDGYGFVAPRPALRAGSPLGPWHPGTRA